MKKHLIVMTLVSSLIPASAFAWEANSIQRANAGRVAMEKAVQLASVKGVFGLGVESTSSLENNGKLFIGVLIRGHKSDDSGQLDCDVALFVNEAGEVVPYNEGFGTPTPTAAEFTCALPSQEGPDWNQGG